MVGKPQRTIKRSKHMWVGRKIDHLVKLRRAKQLRSIKPAALPVAPVRVLPPQRSCVTCHLALSGMYEKNGDPMPIDHDELDPSDKCDECGYFICGDCRVAGGHMRQCEQCGRSMCAHCNESSTATPGSSVMVWSDCEGWMCEKCHSKIATEEE